MPEYTLGAVLAPALVILLELLVLRTGLLRQARYWATLGIVFGFQVLVDGWLTRSEAPVVNYHPAAITGVRFPFDIPVEDWGFGFALATLTLTLWRWRQIRDGEPDA